MVQKKGKAGKNKATLSKYVALSAVARAKSLQVKMTQHPH
jgi:hypothetical protein